MRRQYTRTPLPISAIERMQQERAGIPEGTTCSVTMYQGKKLYRAGVPVANSPTRKQNIGKCPRYATKMVKGKPRCEAHGHLVDSE